MRFTVKLGGSILEDASIRREILREVASLKALGHEMILVHGGGKTLSRRLGQLNIASHFINGLRVTDEATLEVALMVLAGEVNKRIVAELALLGAKAVGLCGADACAVRCVPYQDSGGAADGLGFVGRPVNADGEFFECLLSRGLLPVVSSLALGEDFHFYNINADQMASVCAWAAGSQTLVYLTDVSGVRGSDDSVLREIGRSGIEDLRARRVITGGMLPKTLACLEAIDHGVPSVFILPGASKGILQRFVDGTLAEGTRIHSGG